MTVKELIEKLKEYPQDDLILVQGYEGGFSDIGQIQSTKVDLNYYTEEWNGPHEENHGNQTKAVIIKRK